MHNIDNNLDLPFFRQLANQSRDMIFILNMSSMKYEFINQTTFDKLGYIFDELQSFGINKLLKTIPENLSFFEYLSTVTIDKDTHQIDIRINNKYGIDIFVDVNLSTITQNSTKYKIITFIDISAHIKYTKLIAYKNKLTQSYLDIAKVLIIALDKNKNVLMINQEGANILGYTKEEIVGKNWIDNFLAKTDKNQIDDIANDIINKKQTHTGQENYVLTKSGKKILFRWKNSTLYDEKGDSIGILSSGEDISIEKKHELEINNINKSLQKEVDLQLQKLRKQDSVLLEQSRLAQLGEMISMIAHQWRQPLSTISSISIDMKMKSELENYNLSIKEEAINYEKYINTNLNKIDNLIQNLTTTIDDFRDFYKPNKALDKVTLEHIAKLSLHIMSASLIDKHNINIIEEYNSENKVAVYKNEIMQVILNILKNAQDNFQERQTKDPYIKITTKNNTLTICDNGGGIKKDILPKIFDPYFSTKNEKNGTGLGLYMSKIIIENHHTGKLIVNNTDDGVCFKIQL